MSTWVIWSEINKPKLHMGLNWVIGTDPLVIATSAASLLFIVLPLFGQSHVNVKLMLCEIYGLCRLRGTLTVAFSLYIPVVFFFLFSFLGDTKGKWNILLDINKFISVFIHEDNMNNRAAFYLRDRNWKQKTSVTDECGEIIYNAGKYQT